MHRNAIKMTDGLKLWDLYKDIAFWTPTKKVYTIFKV